MVYNGGFRRDMEKSTENYQGTYFIYMFMSPSLGTWGIKFYTHLSVCPAFG